VVQKNPREQEGNDGDENREDDLFGASALEALAGDVEREGKPVDRTRSQKIRYQKKSGNESDQCVLGSRWMR
jgi:hypothetical protein